MQNKETKYDEIMKLSGADDFKKIINKWEKLSEHLKKTPVNPPIILPDMLWIASPGAGRTTVLKLMADYLNEKKNLMDFYGNVKYFEFYLPYCSPLGEFRAIQRFAHEIDKAAGFRNEYKGIVCIDITEWAKHYDEKHFIAFLEYLATNSLHWMIILSLDSADEKTAKELYSFVSMFLRIEKITLNSPDDNSLLKHLVKQLGEYGITLDASAEKLLGKTISVLRENRYFDGFKTINMLCQDIIYELLSEKELKNKKITSNDLKVFSSDSDYIKKIIVKYESRNSIGFSS